MLIQSSILNYFSQKEKKATVYSLSFWERVRVRALLVILCSLLFPLTSSAFLGEDLWIDLYTKVDEWFYALKQKQYENEITGQGKTTVDQIVGPILADRWLNCEIKTTAEIEELLWNTGEKQVEKILDVCWYAGEKAPTQVVEEVVQGLSYVKNTFSARADEKTNTIYDVARIGLYNDGNLENSPFDLIHDLQEIDKIIFTQEIEYEGVENDQSSDAAVDAHMENGWNTEDDASETPEDNTDEWEDDTDGETSSWSVSLPEGIDTWITHSYMCPPDNTSGLWTDDVKDILDDIENPGGYTPYVSEWTYPGGIPWSGWGFIWDGPTASVPPSGTYNTITDEWGCSPKDFFCIIIEFENSNYGLTGGESMSIEKILAKAAEHLEKPANASLTQRKMTTNNFEIWSMIKNLPDMLRGFGIEVQSKPIPILDEIEWSSPDEDAPKSEVEKKLIRYYKNIGLDYKRRNDLSNFGAISRTHSSQLEQKVLNTAAYMPIEYGEQRLNELSKFQAKLSENNRIISQGTDKQIMYDDMKKFNTQFTELERFVAGIEDFVEALWWHVKRLKKIPTHNG